MTKKIFIIGIICLFIDQVSKSLIDIYFTVGESYKLIDNFLYISSYYNTGVAWGLLDNMRYIIIIISIMAIIVLYRYMFCFKKNIRTIVSFGLLLGGILGNLLDRIILGYVRDFIDVLIFSYDFPVFNFADIFICIGIFLLIISIIKGDDKHETNNGK